jgi:hypothetical protein
VSVLSAADHEVVIAPLAHQLSGELTLTTAPECTASTAFDLRPSLSPRNGNGGAP